ncbi:MAG: GGDEF domain-containing protein [Burkholderiales bacterium]|nr:GGDEF domain-containing protein [Burkholderiales bacterium]
MNQPDPDNAQALQNLADAAAAAPPALLPLLELPSDVAINDWDDLFSAVKSRLTLTVGELSALSEPQARGTADRIRASVLECVGALDQLQTTLTNQIARRQQLELEVFEAQTALALAHAELVGTQAADGGARKLALRDSLTLLPNRAFFRERIDQALARAEPHGQALAVLYLDLDAFKPINDTHGQETGDELLRLVAVRLARTVRAADVVSRLGGDEFGCLLAGLQSRVQLSHLACKLFDAVSAPLKIGELRLTVRPSIGIATCPGDGATADALLRNADAAMCRAKRQKTGYAFWSEPLSP